MGKDGAMRSGAGASTAGKDGAIRNGADASAAGNCGAIRIGASTSAAGKDGAMRKGAGGVSTPGPLALADAGLGLLATALVAPRSLRRRCCSSLARVSLADISGGFSLCDAAAGRDARREAPGEMLCTAPPDTDGAAGSEGITCTVPCAEILKVVTPPRSLGSPMRPPSRGLLEEIAGGAGREALKLPREATRPAGRTCKPDPTSSLVDILVGDCPLTGRANACGATGS